MRLHHIQVACPPDGENEARRFYGEGLGLKEISKPEELAKRGGAWFRSTGGPTYSPAEVHIGVELPFTPAKKSHPAFLVDTEQEFNEIADRLVSLGYTVDWSEKETFPGYLRFHTRDGFGNRVEVLSA